MISVRNNYLAEENSIANSRPDVGYSVSVVIPTLNEAQNLPDVLFRLPKVVDEVIIVDGHSEDDTIEVAMKVLPTAKVILQKRNGKGDALRSAFEHATGDIIVQMDADGSMDPLEIEKFAEVTSEGYDVVKGSRYLFGGGSTDLSAKRSFGNRMFVRLVNLLFSADYTDLCYGYMAFRKDALHRLNDTLKCNGFQIETEMCIKAKKLGLRVKEVPSFEGKRAHGSSRLCLVRDGFRILSMILTEYLKTG
jgi:glycosyltransferase involved in cell wall biosynthesis